MFFWGCHDGFQGDEDLLRELRTDNALDLSESDSDNENNDAESDVASIVSNFTDSEPSDDSDNEPEVASPDWTEVIGEGSNVNVNAFDAFSGPVHDLPDDAQAIDYFKLFIQDSFITHITEQTNLYAEQCQAATGVDKYWKPVCETDIWKYLYINFMFGIHNLPELRLYWSEDPVYRVSAVADLMGRNRFQKINQYFHLNNSAQQPGRDSSDFDIFFIAFIMYVIGHECMHTKLQPFLHLLKPIWTHSLN